MHVPRAAWGLWLSILVLGCPKEETRRGPECTRLLETVRAACEGYGARGTPQDKLCVAHREKIEDVIETPDAGAPKEAYEKAEPGCKADLAAFEEASCKPAAECVPPGKPRAGDDPSRQCRVHGLAVTCPYCEGGGVMKCTDVDGDGCVDLARTECGQPDGCVDGEGLPGAQCKELKAALNLFGVLEAGKKLPEGFVSLHDPHTIAVADDKLTVVIKTRGDFEGPTRWSVALKGAGLDIPAVEAKASYLDVRDDWGILRRDLDITGYQEGASDVVLTFKISDHQHGLTYTAEPLTLQKAGGDR